MENRIPPDSLRHRDLPQACFICTEHEAIGPRGSAHACLYTPLTQLTSGTPTSIDSGSRSMTRRLVREFNLKTSLFRRHRLLRILILSAEISDPGAYLFFLIRRQRLENEDIFHARIAAEHGILLVLRQLVFFQNRSLA